MHLKHLKPSPPASSIVDRCIECGFCESNCPSRDITLTPRQRITTYREISRLKTTENPTADQQQRCASCSERVVVQVPLLADCQQNLGGEPGRARTYWTWHTDMAIWRQCMLLHVFATQLPAHQVLCIDI